MLMYRMSDSLREKWEEAVLSVKVKYTIMLFKGEGHGKIYIFKELMSHSRTYELHGQGQKKKNQYKIKTNKRLTLSDINYLQNRDHGP